MFLNKEKTIFRPYDVEAHPFDGPTYVENRVKDRLRSNSRTWVSLIKCLIFVLPILLTNCTEPPPPTLMSADRKIVDSLYRDSINTLKIEIDSLCELNFDNNVALTVDSIMQERLEEIRKQMRRINGK